MSFDILNDEVNDGLAGRNKGIPMGFDRLNRYVGIRRRILTHVFGATGCLSENTLITVTHGDNKSGGRSYTIRELYYKFHGNLVPLLERKEIKTRSGHRWKQGLKCTTNYYNHDEQSIRQNDIIDVIKSGIKETFILKTEKGKEIRATKDHKFLVDKSLIYKNLSELKVGDVVYIRSNSIPKGRKPRPYRYEIITKMPYYPSARDKKVKENGVVYTHQRIKKTRAVYDAFLNGVSLEYFLEQVKTNPNHGFIFSDLSMDIHHKDEVYNNDVPNNLILLSKKNHARLHGKEGAHIYFGNRQIEEDRILSIEKYGDEMTYDIVMKAPYHNFEANGIFVHNSGKSAFVHSAYILHPFDHLLAHPSPDIKFKVILFSMERSKIYILAKWVSRKIFMDYAVLIPIPKLLGWWGDKYKLTKDEHDLFLSTKDYLDNLLETIDIIEGPQNPTGIYKYVKAYAEANGKIEQIDEYNKVYIPNHPNEIVEVIEDHLGLTKGEKLHLLKKEAIDKLTEYNQWFRDVLGYTPITVSQLTRALSNLMYQKMDSFEPTLDDAKESGNPAEAADMVISLFDPLRYKTNDGSYGDVNKFIDPSTGGNYFRSVKVLKNSYGEDSIRIGMGFHGAIGVLKELPKKDQMDGFDFDSLFSGQYFLNT